MALALLSLILAISLPALSFYHRRGALDVAAASLAGEIARIRQEAIATNRYVGIAFEASSGGDRYAIYRDGGRRGIRTAEIASGLDRLIRGPFDISPGQPGVRLAIPGHLSIPRVPPSRGALPPGSDPIRLGRSDILSFSPIGEATSGSLYLSDREGGLRAVVIYGRTGRIRLWRFDPEAHLWRQ